MLPNVFRVNWSFGSGEETKNRMAAILDFRAERIYLLFDLQITLMLPTKFRVTRPFASRDELKNTFYRWLPLATILDFDQNNFSYF